jgi:hypothetical protein
MLYPNLPDVLLLLYQQLWCRPTLGTLLSGANAPNLQMYYVAQCTFAEHVSPTHQDGRTEARPYEITTYNLKLITYR